MYEFEMKCGNDNVLICFSHYHFQIQLPNYYIITFYTFTTLRSQAFGFNSGKLMTNIEPLPGVLSALISPR